MNDALKENDRLTAEIARLRLTDAEREAIERACCSLGGVIDMSAECTEWDAEARETLLALLERTAGDRPGAINGAESDRPKPITDCPHCDRKVIPTDDPPEAVESVGDSFSDAGTSVETESTPAAWLQRPYWVDPPEGWRYGFPKLYDPAADGDMTEWMIAEGYPERLARQGLACTFSEYRTETGGR